MIRKGILILFLICIFCSCLQNKKNLNCNQVKKGRFELNGKRTGKRYLIERNDSVQFETDQSTGKVIHMKIKWISDCSYELDRPVEMIDTILPEGRRVVLDFVPVKAKIVRVDQDYYVFEAKNEKHDFIYRDTMWILK